MLGTAARSVLAVSTLLAVAASSAAGYGIRDDPATGGAVGSQYRYRLRANAGSPPHTFRLSSGFLPPGIGLTRDGVLTGIPAKSGTFGFYVEAQDAWNPPLLSQRLIEISFIPRLPPAEVGRRFSATLQSPGAEARTWEPISGRFPAGLSLDPSGGAIAGIPKTAGSFKLRFAAPDGHGKTATLEFELVVARSLAITTPRLAGSRLGRPYVAVLHVGGGVHPLRWKIVRGRLPVGLRLNTATGALLGTAGSPGRFPITVKATDALNASSARTYLLTVRRPRR